ncbi:NUDIX hydrolase [Halobaculum sp. MBLA0147]|uniref:NUDIX hydrolase n=1 Tax=Halobaculum sp. MBLA0147 TaxID=3079934 RepID=UPI0035265C19
MDVAPRHCVECGAGLESRVIEGRERPYCPKCDAPRYRNPRPCAGILVVDDDAVLLVQRTVPPAVGSWSVPAGYLEYDEPAPAAACRELAEETGLTVATDALSLLTTHHVTHPDGRTVLVVIYTAPWSATSGTVEAGSDAAAARFWNPARLDRADASVEPGYAPILEAAVANEV